MESLLFDPHEDFQKGKLRVGREWGERALLKVTHKGCWDGSQDGVMLTQQGTPWGTRGTKPFLRGPHCIEGWGQVSSECMLHQTVLGNEDEQDLGMAALG